jgi:hypothetical protein
MVATTESGFLIILPERVVSLEISTDNSKEPRSLIPQDRAEVPFIVVDNKGIPRSVSVPESTLAPVIFTELTCISNSSAVRALLVLVAADRSGDPKFLIPEARVLLVLVAAEI